MKDGLTRFFERYPQLKGPAIAAGVVAMGTAYIVGEGAYIQMMHDQKQRVKEQGILEGRNLERAKLGLPPLPTLTTDAPPADPNSTLIPSAP